MAERYWDHKTSSRHVYMDDTGRVIGAMTLRWTDRTYDAVAYDHKELGVIDERKLGEFNSYTEAMAAVECACVAIETNRAALVAARAAAQADGAEL